MPQVKSKTRSARKSPRKPLPEAPEYVESWAKAVIAAAGRREARGLLEHYRAFARNKRLGRSDRDFAAQRAAILGRLLRTK